MNKIIKAISNPIATLIILLGPEKFLFLSDETYLKIMYKFYMGKKLNLDDPMTFNEKTQWLKINYRLPEHTLYVDKYRVRDYIKATIGEEYLIPLIGVYNDPKEIPFDDLPNSFVLKCNHNSGTGMCICKDKRKIDRKKVIEGLEKGLRENYFCLGREWPYLNVKPCIVCEQYMEDPEEQELRDYKVLCFNGEPKLIELHANRFTNHHTQDFYDIHWNQTDIVQSGLNKLDIPAKKPVCLEKMLDLSQTLSRGMPLVRIDWYVIKGKLYFGEITFFDASGFDGFDDEKNDYLLGSWINLPNG